MPKAEILDPQGKAVHGALARLGHPQITGVRVGKRFELTIDGAVTDEALAEARQVAEELLANTVIEDVVSVRAAGADDEDAAADAATGAGAAKAQA